MDRTSIFGTLLLTLLLCAYQSVCSAAESATFRLEAQGARGIAAETRAGSEHFTLGGDVDWVANLAIGQTFKIVPSHTQTIPSSSSSSSSSTSSSSSSSSSSALSSSSSSLQQSSLSTPSQGGHRGHETTTKLHRPILHPSPSISRSSVRSTASSIPSSIEEQSSGAQQASSVWNLSPDHAAMRPLFLPPSTACRENPCQCWDVALCREVKGEQRAKSLWGIVLLLILILCGGAIGYGRCRKSKGTTRKTVLHRTKKRRARRATLLSLLLITAFLTSLGARNVEAAGAAIPLAHIYNGHLLLQNGSPVSTPVTLRFSYWSSAAVADGDRTGGVLNEGAPTYLQWNEVHTITPTSDGYFAIQLGSITPLPDTNTFPEGTSIFLQVEVKAQADPVASYELLDEEPSNPLIDRSLIASVPFALNARTLQGHAPGSGSGALPVLGSGGLLAPASIPSATNQDFFTIDADNSASGAVALRFGSTVGKALRYDFVEQVFTFNDSVKIEGDLTVTGLINGMALENPDTFLKLTASGGLNVAIASGNYRINGTATTFAGQRDVPLPDNATSYVYFSSGGLTISPDPFPTDQSHIPLAEVVTASGAVESVTDQRVFLSDDREGVMERTLHPQYEGATFQGDGADNVGQMTLSYDNIHLKNFYVWTSSRPTLQDYDILVRITLPEGFKRWRGGLTLQYRSTSAEAASNVLTLQMYDTNGTPVTLTNATNLVSTSWAQTNIQFQGSPVWTAGQECMIRIHMSAKSDEQIQLGDLKFSFDIVR